MHRTRSIALRAAPPLAVASLAVACAGAAAGPAAALSALAGSLAILVPALWHASSAARILSDGAPGRAARLLRSRAWHVATVIVFLAASLSLLGAGIVAPAWLLAVIAQVLAPPLLLAAAAARGGER